jgi:hypothetical protein
MRGKPELPDFSAVSLQASKAVIYFLIHITMAPPLLDYDQSSRIRGKIERL